MLWNDHINSTYICDLKPSIRVWLFHLAVQAIFLWNSVCWFSSYWRMFILFLPQTHQKTNFPLDNKGVIIYIYLLPWHHFMIITGGSKRAPKASTFSIGVCFQLNLTRKSFTHLYIYLNLKTICWESYSIICI